MGGHVLDYAGPNIGVIAAPPDALDPEALLVQADAAMYAAKRLRREAALAKSTQ